MISRFVGDDRGQTTVEYIVLLAVIVGLFLLFAKLFKPVWDAVGTQLVGKMNRNLQGDLHHLRLGGG